MAFQDHHLIIGNLVIFLIKILQDTKELEPILEMSLDHLV